MNRIIVEILSHGSFGISFLNNDKYDMFNVMTLFKVHNSESENELCRCALSTNVTIHEFSHPIINPLT